MKKLMTNKWIGTIAIIAIAGLAIAACGGGSLSGTYFDESGTISLTFKGKSLTTDFGGMKMEGTYEIKGGKIITLSSEGLLQEFDFERQGNTIKLTTDGMTMVYTKR